MEKQPKVLAPDTPIIQDKVVPKPNFAIPQMKHRGDPSSRQAYRMLSGKFHLP